MNRLRSGPKVEMTGAACAAASTGSIARPALARGERGMGVPRRDGGLVRERFLSGLPVCPVYPVYPVIPGAVCPGTAVGTSVGLTVRLRGTVRFGRVRFARLSAVGFSG